MTRSQYNTERLGQSINVYLLALLGGINDKDIAIVCAFFACVYTTFVRPVFVEAFQSFRVEMTRPRVPVAIVVFAQNIIPLDHAPLAYPA